MTVVHSVNSVQMLPYSRVSNQAESCRRIAFTCAARTRCEIMVPARRAPDTGLVSGSCQVASFGFVRTLER
eukprot:6344513-Pyramimonas_sp.AAC.2